MTPGPPTRARQAGLLAVRHAVARYRRLLVAGCVAGAVGAGLQALAPEPAPTAPVWVASADLPAGRVLARGDLVAAAWAPDAAPDGLVGADAALGRRLASALRRGEPVTDARLAGPGLLTAQPAGTLAVVVPVLPAAAGLVRPGDVVDLFAGGGRAVDAFGAAGALQPAQSLARSLRVLAVLDGSGGDDGLLGGAGSAQAAALVVAVDAETARRVAAAGAEEVLDVALRGG